MRRPRHLEQAQRVPDGLCRLVLCLDPGGFSKGLEIEKTAGGSALPEVYEQYRAFLLRVWQEQLHGLWGVRRRMRPRVNA